MNWYGELPKHWEKRIVKNLFYIQKNIAGTEGYNVLSITQKGIKVKDIESNQGQLAQNYSKYQFVNVGDFAMNHMDLLTGWVDCAKVFGVTSPDYRVFVLEDKTQNSDYFLKIFQMCYSQRVFYALGHGAASEGRWRLPAKEFLNFPIPLPPREEQDQIVHYLDWKVSGINKLINAKRRQIALLQEQKQAILNEALESVSNNWQTKRLKYWADSNGFSLGSGTSHNYEFYYLDISSVGRGYIKKEPVKYSFSTAPSRARRLVKFGDTIISTVRTYLRSVCYVNHKIERCIVSTGFSVLSPDTSIVIPELLSFALSTDYFIDEVIRNSIGISYPAINDNTLMSLKISLPSSLNAQIELVNKLHSSFDNIDKIIASLNNEITLFTEYRTRLIYDVVTGKLDVRNVVVPEYKSAEDVTGNEEIEDMEETEDME